MSTMEWFLANRRSHHSFLRGDRKGANLYSSSLVALDANDGKVKWYFQTTHHDIFDYDESAPPALIEITRNGKTIPAVAQSTKQSPLFLFDRLDWKADLRSARTRSTEGRRTRRGDVAHSPDVNTGDIAWQVPLGEFDEHTAKGVPKTGAPNMGEPFATAGGLVLIGATSDSPFAHSTPIRAKNCGR